MLDNEYSFHLVIDYMKGPEHLGSKMNVIETFLVILNSISVLLAVNEGSSSKSSLVSKSSMSISWEWCLLLLRKGFVMLGNLRAPLLIPSDIIMLQSSSDSLDSCFLPANGETARALTSLTFCLLDYILSSAIDSLMASIFIYLSTDIRVRGGRFVSIMLKVFCFYSSSSRAFYLAFSRQWLSFFVGRLSLSILID